MTVKTVGTINVHNPVFDGDSAQGISEQKVFISCFSNEFRQLTTQKARERNKPHTKRTKTDQTRRLAENADKNKFINENQNGPLIPIRFVFSYNF